MRAPLLVVALLPALAGAQTLESVHRGASAAFDGAGKTPEAAAAAAKLASKSQPPLSLSDLARALSHDPKAVDDLLDMLVAKAGPVGGALDTPQRRAEIKQALQNADPAVLDRFPTLTPAGLAQAGELYAAKQGVLPEPRRPAVLVLSLPGAPADPPKDAFLKPLGHGLLYGDETLFGAGAAWGDSKAVAEALNHLSAGLPLEDAGQRAATISDWLGALLAEGHSLEVVDRRMYANFGDLRVENPAGRRDVATPTLVDTGIVLPSGRRVIVPVTHSEFNVSIRGPRVRAELSWFFGLDGRAAFRPMDTTDQGWVGGRNVRSWSAAAAVPLLERAGWVARELSAKAKAGGLPSGGYGPLGDCNDAQAFATGEPPFGMLRDPRLYAGSGALDGVSKSLPYDRTQAVDPKRVWDSRPFERPEDIPLPEVRAAMLELKSAYGFK